MGAVFFCTAAVALIIVTVKGVPCPGLVPPHNGVLKCQNEGNSQVCVATCYNGLEFETGQRVVTRTCDNSRGVWIDNESGEIFEENVLPSCLRLCHDKLLTSTETVRQVSTSSVFASDFTSGPLPLLPLSDGAWRPATDDITQYIQVDLGSQHRLTGVVVRGDTVGSYVKLFRLLFSTNGVTWHPYSDGRNPDQFLTGNFDTSTEVTLNFGSPQTARYVRINPLSWQQHIALRFDLLGCSDSKFQVCRTPEPPQRGAVNCERNETHLLCTAYCSDSLVFDGQGPATDITCEERLGVNVSRTLPACVIAEFTQCPETATKPCRKTTPTPCQAPSTLLCTSPCKPAHFVNTPRIRQFRQLSDVGYGASYATSERQPTNPVCVNVSGFCLQEENDCHQMPNGDYQYCGNCHYFSTCSEGYFYVRPCPEHLVYDSLADLCNYKSSTCSTKSRLLCKRTRAHLSLPSFIQQNL